MYLARKEALGGLRDCIPAGAEEHVGALHHMMRCGCHGTQAGCRHGHHACTRASSAQSNAWVYFLECTGI